MRNNNKNLSLHGWRRAAYEPARFVFRSSAAYSADEQNEAEAAEQQQALEQQKAERSARNQDLRSRVAAIQIKGEDRELLRELLVTQTLENENLVDQFLRREIGIEQVRKEANEIADENRKWGDIFKVQRAVRTKIQELQYRAETYVEIIPRGKQRFDAVMDGIRKLNIRDDRTDRDLKKELGALLQGNDKGVPAGSLSESEAKELFGLDPTKTDFYAKMSKFKTKIEKAVPNGVGKRIYSKIKALKEDEAREEREFAKLYEQLDKVVQQNVSKVRNEAEKERMLEIAGKSIGINLAVGVEIQFDDPDILDIEGDTVKINKITWDEMTILDHDLKAIDKIPGVMYIHLSNGAKMPIGRFKKWVDAAGGVQNLGSTADVEKAIYLEPYGTKIKKGMSVTYPRYNYDEKGERTSYPVTVEIVDIKDGHIIFNEPVPFQPGYTDLSPEDMRNSMTFGQFSKWWHRYEVEKSIGLQELRDALIVYNTLQNKAYGREAASNPPIRVEDGETLIYPDEIGRTFTIKKVEPGGVLLDTGRKSFPEFLSWVKFNRVERAPETKGSQAEQAMQANIAHLAGEAKEEEEIRKERETHKGIASRLDQQNEQARAVAASPLERVKQLWFETQLLSLKDLWNMGEQVVEFVKRKHERRSKGRYGDVGSRLPGVLGTEFDRIRQSAEDEEANKYKEAMEHWGIPDIQRTLHDTNSKDEAKAAILTLVHKGEMRWDDHHFWQALNRLTARYTLKGAALRIPDNIPYGESGEDLARKSIDALWGEGQAAEWYGENTSKYNSQKDHFEYSFKQLENDPKGIGGPAGQLKMWLKQWQGGEYVNGQEYEEMIDAAIKYGKMTAEKKMFYLMAGVLMRKGQDPHGETLLHMDRIGELNSKYLNQFPMLDFFTQTMIMDYSIWDDTKKQWGKSRKLKFEDIVGWKDVYFPDDFKNCDPGSQFSRFMWEKMLMSEETRTRISKGLRNAENMDHDDAHIIIPLSAPSEVDNLTMNATGQKKYFTNEGYMNGLVGFNQYFMTLKYAHEEAMSEEDRTQKVTALKDAVNSFIRYDLILANRFKKSVNNAADYARLDARHYSRAPVVDDGLSVGKHQEQLRNLIVAIGNAYGKNFSFLYSDQHKTGSMLDKEEKKKQEQFEILVEGLKDEIVNMMSADNGEKAFAVIGERVDRSMGGGDNRPHRNDPNSLRGLPGSERPVGAELAKLQGARRQFAMHGPSSGGGH